MNQNQYITDALQKAISLKQAVLGDKKLLQTVAEVASVCSSALRNGNKVLLAGNGGSAADSQHIAAEFVSRFAYDRPGLAAIALTTDSSILTAIGNDYGYERLFVRQLEALSRPGDIFIGFSTSGNSPNVIGAFERCKELGVTTVAMAGSRGKIQTLCDYLLAVPSESTARIQEVHILFGHLICGLVEADLFPEHQGDIK